MSLSKLLNHPILLEMVVKGIEPTIKAGGLHIEGFYKSGSVLLYIDHEDNLVAQSRYNEIHRINSLQDLVELNLEWWERSNHRNASWIKPEEPWRSIAIEMGLLKEIVETYVTYERK